jgi:hypothetical protein
LSTAQLMECLGLRHRPSFRKNYLHPALDAGLLHMTHPGFPSSPSQRYRLTARARGARRDGMMGLTLRREGREACEGMLFVPLRELIRN